MARHRRSRSATPKRISQHTIIGQEGVNLVERVLLSMGFPWYPTGAVKAGIDGYFEIRDPETGEVHNAIVQAQSKATRDALGKPDADTVEFICCERDINYWMSGNAPVILVRSRPSEKNQKQVTPAEVTCVV